MSTQINDTKNEQNKTTTNHGGVGSTEKTLRYSYGIILPKITAGGHIYDCFF